VIDRESKTARYIAKTYGELAAGWLELGRVEDAERAARVAWTWAQRAAAKAPKYADEMLRKRGIAYAERIGEKP
jgi:hypothetical protein